MPPVREPLEIREQRGEDWKIFRKNSLLTQRQLAKQVGISRRTIQLVEGGYITPHHKTLRRFLLFKSKYDGNAKLHGKLVS